MEHWRNKQEMVKQTSEVDRGNLNLNSCGGFGSCDCNCGGCDCGGLDCGGCDCGNC